MKIEVFNLSRRRVLIRPGEMISEGDPLAREVFDDFMEFQQTISYDGLLFAPTTTPLDPNLPIPTFCAPYSNKGAFVRFTYKGREILCNTMDLLKCRSIDGTDSSSDVTIEQFIRYLDTHEQGFSPEELKRLMHELHPDVMT